MELILALPEGTNPAYAEKFAKAIRQALADRDGQDSWAEATQYHRRSFGTIAFTLPDSGMRAAFGISIDVTSARIRI